MSAERPLNMGPYAARVFASARDPAVGDCPTTRDNSVLSRRLVFGGLVVKPWSAHEVTAGDSLLVTRDTPHSYWNAAAELARCLLVMTPQIHQLIEALHAGDHTDFAVIFEEHDSELLA
jgi:hypothetical protein